MTLSTYGGEMNAIIWLKHGQLKYINKGKTYLGWKTGDNF